MAVNTCTGASVTLSGMNVSCKETSLGGIKEVYIALYSDVSATTVATGTNLLTPVMNSSKKFKSYILLKNTGSLTSTLETNDNSTNSFTNEVTLQFKKMETAKRMEIMALMSASCAVIVKDSNNHYWYLGKDDYVECSAGSATTGTDKGDANQYELTLTDISSELPFEVDPACISGIVDPVGA